MRSYLVSFLNTFAYDPSDAAYLCGVYDRITADADAGCLFQEAITAYREETSCDHTRLVSLADAVAQRLNEQEYTVELLLYICLSQTLQERYRERGIDEEIFYNTMLDLRYKLDECKAVKGIVGTFVASWFAGFFEMTRFALGRLQFEIVPFGEHYGKDGKTLTPDSKVINVHIPRTKTPLDEERCREAYRRALAFFAQEIDVPAAFVCYSWLLYPENETILSKDSNIVRFMKQYDVIKWGVDKNKTDLWRLFDTDEHHPDRLPTDTTARRRYVEHIKRGGKLGWGYGVFFA